MIEYKPGDIFFVRGMSLLARLIRFFSRGRVNHTGIISTTGNIKEVNCIEAMHKVIEGNLFDHYGSTNNMVEIWRPINLTAEDQEIIILTAWAEVGMGYGYFDLVMHLFDAFLFNVYLFRRLGKLGPWGICSWLVIKSFNAANYSFGLKPHEGQPDDIRKFCQETEGVYYEKLRPLALM